jgi:hypothetical protein
MKPSSWVGLCFRQFSRASGSQPPRPEPSLRSAGGDGGGSSRSSVGGAGPLPIANQTSGGTPHRKVRPRAAKSAHFVEALIAK